MGSTSTGPADLEAVNHLALLRHSRIAFIGYPDGSGVGDDRRHGWQRAMDTLGLPAKGLLVRGEAGFAAGKALADQLIGSSNPPTALVCVSDAMAVGAMRAVEDRGLRVGHDIAIVGFDDSAIASVLRPRLSSVRQPVESVAHQLVEVLLAELMRTSRRPSHFLLPPSLVVRESSEADLGTAFAGAERRKHSRK